MRNLCPRNERLGVEVAEEDSAYQQALQRAVDGFHGHLSVLQRLRKVLIDGAAFYVCACNNCCSCCYAGCWRNGVTVFHLKVTNCATVADNNSVEAPFIAENALEVAFVSAARVAIDSLVGAHNLCNVSFLNK